MDVHEIQALTDELREAFDSAFKEPIRHDDADTLDLVLIGVHGEHYAVPITELGGIRRCPALTPVPSQAAGVCGVAGVRGSLAVVFSLAALLAEPSAHATTDWLLLPRARSDIALGCSAIEGYRRLATAEVSGTAGGSRRGEHRLGAYRDNDETFEIISVTGWIQELAAAASVHAERSRTR